MNWKIEKLGNAITHRKEFTTIDNSVEYKRCRVQVNRKGVVLRDIVKGVAINTKKQQVCRESDFLVAEIDAKVGGYGFVPGALEGAIVSSHYFLFEVDESKLLKEYLAWLIKTDIIQEQITSKGSTNYAAIRPHHVLNFEIPLPSVGEQAIIVRRLNNINEGHTLIAKEINQQQSYLQLLRQTILQEAVQGKLTSPSPLERGLGGEVEPATALLKRIKAEKEKLLKAGKLKKEQGLSPITEDEIPFELPEGCVWCRLGEVIEFIGGSQPPKNKFVHVEKEGYIRLVQIRDFKSDGFKTYVPVQFANRMFNDDDIMIGRYGPPVFQILRGLSGTYNVALIKAIPIELLMTKDYCFYLLQEPRIQKIIIDDSERTAGQSGIRKPLLESIVFPLPPLAEQHHIVAKVQQLQQKLSQLEAQVQQSRQYAQHLLQSVLKEAFEQKANVYEMGEKEVSMVAED